MTLADKIIRQTSLFSPISQKTDDGFTVISWKKPESLSREQFIDLLAELTGGDREMLYGYSIIHLAIPTEVNSFEETAELSYLNSRTSCLQMLNTIANQFQTIPDDISWTQVEEMAETKKRISAILSWLEATAEA